MRLDYGQHCPSKLEPIRMTRNPTISESWRRWFNICHGVTPPFRILAVPNTLAAPSLLYKLVLNRALVYLR
jgi:hypothetical protein